MNQEIKISKYTRKEIKEIKKIYYSSFSKEEEFSLCILLLNSLRKNIFLYVLKVNNQVKGFIYFIVYQDNIYLLYLAISTEERNKGYGSYLLNWLQTHFKEKKIYLTIQEIQKKYEDCELRERRLKFYLKNHFYLTGYISIEYSYHYPILSNTKEFDLKKFLELDKKISHQFFTRKCKIKKQPFCC